MRADQNFLFLRKKGDRDTEIPTAFSSTFSPVQYSKLQNITPLRSQNKNWSHKSARNAEDAQTEICYFFTEIASCESPQQAIDYFKDLFILKNHQVGKEIEQALYDIIVLNREEDFFILLDRCCSILTKQWLLNKQEKYIAILLDLFNNEIHPYQNLHPTRRRLKEWIADFRDSKSFESLQLFLPDDRPRLEGIAT
ncbi:MAG: hypothetical protein AB4290_00885, partial [Spirulina sp.]